MRKFIPCYIKVTCHSLRADLQVSIYQTAMLAKGPQATARSCAAMAARNGTNASYEAVTREEYIAFRESQRAAIADAAMAVAREVQS